MTRGTGNFDTELQRALVGPSLDGLDRLLGSQPPGETLLVVEIAALIRLIKQAHHIGENDHGRPLTGDH